MASLPVILETSDSEIKRAPAPRRKNATEIEFALRDLVSRPYDAETFPYDLIAISNASKMTVSRLKSGTTNKATRAGDVLWQKQFFFKSAQPGEDVGAVGDALMTDPLTARNKPRFILVTNGEQIHIRDLKFEETVNVEFERLDEESDFLLPLAGYERRVVVEEHPADKKAAKKLKKLYDAILAANPTWNSGHHSHELNLLMTRLLFCFYAEKTGIFATPKVFSSTLTDFTREDGTEVAPLLDRLFRIMNVEESSRPKGTPASEARFPYVNGSLFEDTVELPAFSRTARRQLLECGDLDWTTINPDIFGSMIQTIAQDGIRSDLGMHYTSVPNIMKVLQPLFLDDLHEAFEKSKGNVLKLEALLGRLSKIRVFDPACGSGNFLIIAYKALRKIETDILVRIEEISPKAPLRLSTISLHNFYGIDVVDFACETAKLSLWIAEYQQNAHFKELFGTARPPLPLARISTIYRENATRCDWLIVCPKSAYGETYICGNPPFQGGKKQRVEEKQDLALLFSKVANNYKNLDYVSCWLLKAAAYIEQTNCKAAFVATNSICQGDNVGMLWPVIYSHGAEIDFAYTSFRWSNSAAHNAGVTCVIVGLANVDPHRVKRLYSGDHVSEAKNIGPYLTASRNIIVGREAKPIQGFPEIVYGSKPLDNGFLTVSATERSNMISQYPQALNLIREYFGTDEFVDGVKRWCLWIPDDLLPMADSIPPIKSRLRACRKFREGAGMSAKSMAATPHRFMVRTHRETDALLIPMVTSERRRYLQIGLMPPTSIINSNAYALYDPQPYILAVLSSRLHRIWAVTVGGQLETRIRYSNTLIYNTFPIPALSDEQKRILGERAAAILRARAKPGKTIAWLYNPETMPPDLLKAHENNDAYLEEHVYGRSFQDDTQRLEHLFAMYAREKDLRERGHTLFAKSRSRKAE